MDSLQNFTTFTKTYYNVVCSRDALSHFIRCWWEIISSVQILLYACTTFPCISFEWHEGKDKIKCYFIPLLCTFLYIYFEYELYVWCQWVRRKNIIVFYEICSSILSKYCNIMVIIIFITPRDDVMQTLYIVWAEWWWRLLSPLAGHVWYGVAHNSIFLHLFFYSSAPSQCQGKHSNSKISFHRWKNGAWAMITLYFHRNADILSWICVHQSQFEYSVNFCSTSALWVQIFWFFAR